MSEFEDFARSQGLSGDFQRGCNGQYKSDLLHFMEKAFMHQQSEIDQLKTQLAVYKEDMQKDAERISELQKRVDEYENLTTSIRNEFNLWTDGREFADVIEAQIENLEALRGEHE